MASFCLNSSAGRMQTALMRTGTARPQTSGAILGVTPTSLSQIPEGKYTAVIYTFIRDGKYQEVIKILTNELQAHPKSRPALSLLAYAHYQTQDFLSACTCYEQLISLVPKCHEYKLYYAQSLLKSGNYELAQKISNSIDDPALKKQVGF
jgi:tetratricopeptide repeat protein 30